MKYSHAAIFALLIGPASAQVADQNLAPLQDDLSRQQLFSKVIAAQAESEPGKLTSFPLPKDFFFPQDVVFDSVANTPRNNVVFGIDISHHTDSKLDLSLLKMQRVEFVYVKATQGSGYRDPKFASYWKTLSGLPDDKRPLKGAYHFLSAGIPGQAQADTFVNFVKANGGFGADDLPPCLDLEWDVTSTSADRWEPIPTDEILANAKAWLDRVQALTGRTPMIYTARSWWMGRQIPESAFAMFDKYPIWIADYSKTNKATEKPNIINARQQHIWQFADNAKLTIGFAGGTLDANIFYGSLDQLKAAYK